jgi:thiamine kinase-like enzyme
MNQMITDRSVMEIEALPFWSGPIKVWPLSGGVTNRNYGVQQADGQRFAVRLGQDIPQHGVLRFNEQSAASAAARAGISPKIFYTAPGVTVTRLLPGRSLEREETRLSHNRTRIVSLLKRCHTSMSSHLRGPLLAFWVFHINRSYAGELLESGCRIYELLPRLIELNDVLEKRVGKVEMVFGHNDLLAGNIYDDGARLWLLDWDYAGFNSPLFDLANLSSNNGYLPDEDADLLEDYYGHPPDAQVMDSFRAMKCASILREVLWSAVSERNSELDFDYASYTNDYLARLEGAIIQLG